MVWDLDASTDEGGDDDLDQRPTKIRRTIDQAVDEYAGEVREVASSSSDSIHEVSSDDPITGRKKLAAKLEGERLEWSSDDATNVGEAVYKKFKERKSEHRKKALASTRKAKTIETETRNSVVGLKRKPPKDDEIKKRSKKTAAYGEDSDDDLMEYTLPDYLQNRRSRFEGRKEKLKEAGLKLPPVFDDVEFSDDERLQDLREKPEFPNSKPLGEYEDIQLPYSLGLIPAPIAQRLRDYQVKGAEFLHELFVYQKGGVLGDDMGLGKTVQVIAFLTAAYGKTADERDFKRMRKMRRMPDKRWYPRTLIICPGSLIANWRAEFQTWGWWHVDVFHGSKDAKSAALEAARAGRTEILVTTYTTYRMNKSALNMVDWDCVVADECHTIKERKADITQAMNEVNALCRIGLTGTAIQNKYEELWTLLNWTNPGKFGPVSTWKASICEPLKIGQSHDATVYQLSKARKTAKKLVENLLPEFFLRRMKSLIADQLPKKTDRVVFCPLTDTQADAYENYLESDVVQYIKLSAEICECGSGKKQGWCCKMFLPEGGKWQNYVFPAIVTLQKMSNHLASLIPQGTDPKEKQEKDLDTLQIAMPDQWEELYRDRDSILNYSNPEFCGKWRVLKKLLKFWHNHGDKVLVFSHSVRLLKMLQLLFNHTTYNVAYLDGAMRYEDRAKTVDDFNSDPQQFVFLISTRAGGVGLNITSANKVVVVDPNWNPSYDLQAQDRAYRIGQTRDVEVFRLVSAGTIEEIVYARQIYKQQQANIGYNASNERRYFKGVQEKADQKGEIFGLANLFEYQNNNIVLRDIVNKTNIAESRAGVRIADIEFDHDSQPNLLNDGGDERLPINNEPNDENAAMTQLATLISSDEMSSGRQRGKTAAPRTATAPVKHDPVQAILSRAGVEYTHDNSEVIGSSTVEARLSRHAVERADPCAPSFDATIFAPDTQPDVGGLALHPDGRRAVKYLYRPPRDVVKRQFCSMARWAGWADAVGFAVAVEGWTPARRRAVLERFYSSRRAALLGGRGRPPGEARRQGGADEGAARPTGAEGDEPARVAALDRDDEAMRDDDV